MNGLVKKIGVLTSALGIGGGAIAAAQEPVDQAVFDALKPANAQEDVVEKEETPKELKKWTLTPGYNALQGGMTDDGELRGRLYTSIEGRLGKFTLGIVAVNEGGNQYFFGESKGYTGIDGIPVSVVHMERYGLIPGEGVTRFEGATGLRLDLEGMIPGTHYGSLDVMKHTAVGEEGTNDYEAILFLGRDIGKGGLEVVFQVMEGGRLHAEVEGIGPAITEGAHYVFRPMARLEYNHEVPGVPDGPVLIGALQIQFQ